MPKGPGMTLLVKALALAQSPVSRHRFHLYSQKGVIIKFFFFYLYPTIKTRAIACLGLPMPSSDQLLSLPNLQRNLLFTSFLKSPTLFHIVESRAAVHNSPAIRNTINLFHTYVAFRNFYVEKPAPYDEYDGQMGRLVLDICGETLDLLSNLGFCGILAAIPDNLAASTIERVLRSLSGPNLVVYLDSGNPSNLPTMSPARNSPGPNPPHGDGPPVPTGNHPGTPTLDIRNPSIRSLSALASRIARALVEGRPPILRSTSITTSTSPHSSPSPTPIPAPIARTPRRRPRTRLLSCYSCGSRTHFKLDCPQYICSGCDTAAPGHNLSACPNCLNLPDEATDSDDGTL